MINPHKIKNYFIYDDKLRTFVSVVTGIIILFFNFLSGFMLVYIFLILIFSGSIDIEIYKYEIGLSSLLLGIAAGAGVMKFEIFIFDKLLNGVQIEKYSYIRMILLISIALFFLILFFYLLTKLVTGIQTSIMHFVWIKIVNSIKLFSADDIKPECVLTKVLETFSFMSIREFVYGRIERIRAIVLLQTASGECY